MILRTALIIFLITLVKTAIFSQIHYTAVVCDSVTLEPLPYATVKYNNKYTGTDLKGKFSVFTDENELHITVSYTGYHKYSKTITSGNAPSRIDTILLRAKFNLLDKITITSSRYLKRIEDATVSITTFKAKFLERNRSVNFENILDKIPGVNFIDGQVSIRGGSGFTYGAGSRVMVLYDNLPALQFDSALPVWDNIPTEAIERVEVVKGAGSVLYGSAAMNGVINIIPVKPEYRMKLKVNIFHRIYDSPKDKTKKWWTSPPIQNGTSFLFAKKAGKLGIVTSAYYQGSDGYKKDCFNYYGRATIRTDYQITGNLNAGIHVNYNKGKKVTFFFWKNMNEGAYIGDPVAYSGADRQMIFLDPYLTYKNNNGWHHKLKGRAYFVSNLVGVNTYDISKSYYGEYQAYKKFENPGLTLTAGIVGSNSNTTAKLYADTTFSVINNAVYLQLEKKFFGRLTLNSGIRTEYYAISGPSTVGGIDIKPYYDPLIKNIFRFGVNYRLFSNTNIRASWGQGLRYPTVAEKFSLADEGDLRIVPNPALKPESGFTAETGIRHEIKSKHIAAYMDIAAFHSEYDNMIELELRYKNGFYFTSVNLANTVIKGIELESGLSVKYGDWRFDLNAGYLYIDPKYKNFDESVKKNLNVDYNVLKYRMRHTFKTDFELSYKGFSIGGGNVYHSFMEAIDKIFDIELLIKDVKKYRELHPHGNNIYRLRMAYKFKNIKYQFNIDNLFNTEYSIRPGILEAPRSFMFTTTLEI